MFVFCLFFFVQDYENLNLFWSAVSLAVFGLHFGAIFKKDLIMQSDINWSIFTSHLECSYASPVALFFTVLYCF